MKRDQAFHGFRPSHAPNGFDHCKARPGAVQFVLQNFKQYSRILPPPL